ncbi:uracil-DNA glycosylase [Dictyocaulus viviparus]|uniref:Uracil-DNA glycosylase n=1 Tax=Dictyocaulus viviparus TaxID=29172 RepID=A0A0D8Y0K7_DICVI|nr:uracil-DNA glycosylase [Dictyocaulus viviparus]
MSLVNLSWHRRIRPAQRKRAADEGSEGTNVVKRSVDGSNASTPSPSESPSQDPRASVVSTSALSSSSKQLPIPPVSSHESMASSGPVSSSVTSYNIPQTSSMHTQQQILRSTLARVVPSTVLGQQQTHVYNQTLCSNRADSRPIMAKVRVETASPNTMTAPYVTESIKQPAMLPKPFSKDFFGSQIPCAEFAQSQDALSSYPINGDNLTSSSGTSLSSSVSMVASSLESCPPISSESSMSCFSLLNGLLPEANRSADLKEESGTAASIPSTTQYRDIMSSTSSTKIPEMFLRALKRKRETTGEIDKKSKVVSEGDKENVLTCGPSSFCLFNLLTQKGWRSILKDEFNKKYMKDIEVFLKSQYDKKITIFPPREEIFSAFNFTALESIRVVIIGQDPYHGAGQAHGMSFSVKKGVTPPPSLKNIYRELSEDIPGFIIPNHGFLQNWALQGVFMLNATLTVESGKANSHEKIGWQTFTDKVISLISLKSSGVVFLLWGGFAHKKESLIDLKKHAVIKTAHPSPLSAQKWFGCKCFSKANAELLRMGRPTIEWSSL